MINLSDKYLFSDFTFCNYERLLEIANQTYEFNFFNEKPAIDKKTIFLRHDVEFSVPIALKMAEVEKKHQIKATYFIQVHSAFYNPFDEQNLRFIKKISEYGHELGLHFDTHFWDISSEEQLDEKIKIDASFLESFLQTRIRFFSFHNTNDFVLSCNKEFYAGLINVYSSKFKNTIGYISDSTGYWRFERLEDRLKEGKYNILQILIHDAMWQDEVLPPRQRLFKTIDERAKYLKDYYDKTLKEFGAKNIDWSEVL